MKLTDRQLSILREVVKRGPFTVREVLRQFWAVSPVLAQLFKKRLVNRRRISSKWLYYPNEKGKQVLLDTLLEE